MCRSLAFVAISAILAQVAFGQAIVPLNSLLSNQVVLNSLAPNLVSLAPSCYDLDVVTPIVQAPIVQAPIVQAPVVPATTTIVQDNSVANNLANTLQLLIVSNLLSQTLPNLGDVIVPACGVDVVPSYAPISLAGLDVVAPLTTFSPLALSGLNGISYVF